VAVAASVGAGSASAATYGGGRLSTFASKHYTPTALVTLRTHGRRVGVRFETTLKCGREVYSEVTGIRSATLRNGRAQMHGRGTFGLERGRIRYRWKLSVKVGPQAATGVLTIKGRRTTGVHRCTVRPRRPFKVLREPRVTGPRTAPRRGGVYRGLNATRLQRKYRGSVIVRVSGNGRRVEALWEAGAGCRSGLREVFANFTPPTRIRPDHSFRRSERFRVVFAEAVVRYRVSFAGHFTAGGAAGTLRLTAHGRGRRGRHFRTSCDSGTRRWRALAG
jgi:hypothetical protein